MEKEQFWNKLEGILGEIPEDEAIWIGGGLNGHVGIDNEGFEEIMGKHGVGSKNEVGERVKDFSREYGMAILNTFFEKRQSQKVTYSNGGFSTQVDYLLGRRQLLKEVVDCKVLPNESVARQHRPVVFRLKCGQKRVKR